MQVSVFLFLNAEFSQVFHSGSLERHAGWVEARTMTWTLKPKVTRFEQAAQMRALKTDRLESFLVVDDDRRDVGKHGAAVERIVVGGTNVEFGLRRFVELVAQEFEQSANAEYTCQGEKGVG